MVWNWPHIHIMINHTPVLGSMFGLLLLIGGYASRSRDMRRAALVTLSLSGLAAVVTLLTGFAAEESLNGATYVSPHYIEHHEELASFATSASVLLGIFSAYLFIRFKGRDIPHGLGTVLIAGGLIVSGLMAWAANYGGNIHHQEIRSSEKGHELHEGYEPPIGPGEETGGHSGREH